MSDPTAARGVDTVLPRLAADPHRAELLLRISNGLAATQSLDDQLDMITEIARHEIGAERGSIFLNDSTTNELYARIRHGGFDRQVRILNSTGLAGWVFTTGRGVTVDNPYEDERFNRTVDELTGYTTRSIVAAPVRTVKGEILGVIQLLNKEDGDFDAFDLELLEAMATQASIVLQSTLYIAKMQDLRKVESQFLDVVAEVSSEIQLGPLLQKIMGAVTRMLDSDRSTLFLNDEATQELYTEIGQGLGATTIRFPNSAGIAGTVFTTGQTINIPHAYADLRFNPAFDKQTGYFTRSILCVPVTNKDGKRIGVTQVLNKRGGAFTTDDEHRLRAFTAQISIGIENAKLFRDVQRMKNYNESILESMTNGVVTTDGDGRIVTCNAAGTRILRARADDVVGRTVDDFFRGDNAWVVERLQRVARSGEPDLTVDAELRLEGDTVSVNLTTLPLRGHQGDSSLGSLLLLEDISSEKRVRSTMARYMDPALADRLLQSGEEDILGGKSQGATVLFSDIRSFTTLTEELGPQGTVSLLNEYFTVMVDCIARHGGMLDKFIGDAMMAVFGIPLAQGDDEDRAVRAAVSMLHDLRRFNEQRVAHGQKPVQIGIGLNTGNVVSGNIGSPKRMDYTVIGDGVNLAARLEGACKTYGAQLLVSEFTMSRLKGTYRAREIDRVIVKGKTEPVGVYEILEHVSTTRVPRIAQALRLFEEGLAAYREQNWKLAAGAFEAVLAQWPDDAASKLYLDRCALLADNPPPKDWGGVWKMTTK